MGREKLLIVDDSEMNRSILADILGNTYDIIEAEDGVQAIVTLQKMNKSIDLVLLDIVMPNMDGFDVLEAMNENRLIDDVPVIMVSAEREAAQLERAYDLGVTDFIMRPFDAVIIRRRVENTLLLYAKQKRLIAMVEEQVAEKEKYSSTMIDILSHIVEVRNGESGLHVLRVRMITDFLLKDLKQRTDKYDFSDESIRLIRNASALHDIGKIAIDEAILNKPGKLTDEEYGVMKKHTLIGARMLQGESIEQNNPLVKTAYDICRWHHERYDGKGYPDGLKGDNIPLSAQVVALADVYDALVSPRVYKKPYTHEEAVQMILNGECGAFNPLLMNTLKESSDALKARLEGDLASDMDRIEIKDLADAVMNSKTSGVSERTLRQLAHERMKNSFFSAMTEEIQFEYTISSHVLTFSSWGAKKLGVSEIIMDVNGDARIQQVIGGINWREMLRMMNQTTPEKPEITFECKINCNGEYRWHRVKIRSMWSDDDKPKREGALGKAVDIHDTRLKMEALRKRAARDGLTGLLNLENSKIQIENLLENNRSTDYMMAIIDVDFFKLANDTYGHQFGNQVLQHIAEVLNKGLRGGDISSRIGGDEFLLFMECGNAPEHGIRRIFTMLSEAYEDYTVSISMGVAKSADVGMSYEEMFQAADKALYYAKENGRHQYCFYVEAMRDMFSQIPDRTDFEIL